MQKKKKTLSKNKDKIKVLKKNQTQHFIHKIIDLI